MADNAVSYAQLRNLLDAERALRLQAEDAYHAERAALVTRLEHVAPEVVNRYARERSAGLAGVPARRLVAEAWQVVQDPLYRGRMLEQGLALPDAQARELATLREQVAAAQQQAQVHAQENARLHARVQALEQRLRQPAAPRDLMPVAAEEHALPPSPTAPANPTPTGACLPDDWQPAAPAAVWPEWFAEWSQTA